MSEVVLILGINPNPAFSPSFILSPEPFDDRCSSLIFQHDGRSALLQPSRVSIMGFKGRRLKQVRRIVEKNKELRCFLCASS
jgi:hypothetical protein